MARSNGLQRLKKLYAMLDRLKTIELKAARDDVEALEQTAARIAGELASAAKEARIALASGSRLRSQAIQTATTAEMLRRHKLQQLDVCRRAVYVSAMEAYQQSRVAALQMESLSDLALRTERDLARRREQADADDGFLSRHRQDKGRGGKQDDV